MSEEILEPLAACVHCGFCLPACPTYLATGDEADSPRGRIHLMRALAHQTIAATDAALGEHLDACLGCRGCEPVCPSGVRYGEGLEAARAALVRARGLPFAARATLAVFRRRWLWRPILALAHLFRATRIPDLLAGGGRIGFPMAMLAATRPSLPPCPPPSPRRKPGPSRPTQLFSGCVMDGLFSHVHRATGAALANAGLRMERPRGQACCGALHAHAGDLNGARALARTNITAFRGTEGPIVVNSAGCGAMLKGYHHLLGTTEAGTFASRVKDIAELLPAGLPYRPASLRITYDAPCHLQHAQGITDQPLALLAQVPGLSLVPLPDSDQCCGSAGIFSITEPAMSRAVLTAKVSAIGSLDPAPDLVLTGNPGCLMQIGAGLRIAGTSIRTAHPVELLAAVRDWVSRMPGPSISVTREELAVVRHGALLVVTEPAAFSIAGPGAVTCLQGLLTNDIQRPGEHSLVYGALLTPKGMIIADAWTVRTPQEILLLAHPEARTAIAEVFLHALPPRLARVTDQTGTMRAAWLVGAGAVEALTRAGLGPLPDAAGKVTVIDTVRGRLLAALGHDHTPFAGFLAGPESAIALAREVLGSAGVSEGDARLLDAARIIAGWPALGAEIGERTLPQEARFDEIGGVSYTKGCYTGQETVARVHFRGHVNRELRGLRWDHPSPPESESIVREGKEAGTVRSLLLLDDRALALAPIRREVAVGETVEAGGRLATVVALPFGPADLDG